jgi:hypothetical protein
MRGDEAAPVWLAQAPSYQQSKEWHLLSLSQDPGTCFKCAPLRIVQPPTKFLHAGWVAAGRTGEWFRRLCGSTGTAGWGEVHSPRAGGGFVLVALITRKQNTQAELLTSQPDCRYS